MKLFTLFLNIRTYAYILLFYTYIYIIIDSIVTHMYIYFIDTLCKTIFTQA